MFMFVQKQNIKQVMAYCTSIRFVPVKIVRAGTGKYWCMETVKNYLQWKSICNN